MTQMPPSIFKRKTVGLIRFARHREKYRERLFRAALKLFGEKGFAETTIEDITKAADLGKGTFFNYFPTKEHILIAFGEMQVAKLEKFVKEAGQSKETLSAQLRRLITLMTEEPVRNPEIVRALIQANLSSPRVRKGMMKIHDRNRDLVTQLMRQGQERGEVRTDLEAEEIAQGWRQMIFGTLLFWSLSEDQSLPQRIESAFRVLWNGIATRNTDAARSAESTTGKGMAP
ncbi:MAG TPA: TetR/AcrR family transcriptional regulator [Terriglobales bacterium]|nr:TetR/AcrR family transcriptional regulator [Terriglobales bacterium]